MYSEILQNNWIGLRHDILITISVADCKIKVHVKNIFTSKAILADTVFSSIEQKVKFKFISKMDGVNAREAWYINERSIANCSKRFNNIWVLHVSEKRLKKSIFIVFYKKTISTQARTTIQKNSQFKSELETYLNSFS